MAQITVFPTSFSEIAYLFALMLASLFWGFPSSAIVKNAPANAGDLRDTGLILGSGRSLGIGNGNTLQYSCLENPMDQRTLVGYSP